MGVCVCVFSGLLYALEAIVMAKAHHLDNLIITHFYTIFVCVAIVPYSNFEQWERVEIIEWIILLVIGFSGSLA